MTVLYATLDELKTEIKTEKDIQDDVILRAGQWASARVANKLAKKSTSAEPVIQTRVYPAQKGAVLTLGGSLVEVLDLSVNSGDVTVPAQDYLLQPYAPPYRMLNLIGSQSFAGYGSSAANANRVRGVWVYHSSYGSAWEFKTAVEETAYPSVPYIKLMDTTGLAAGMLLKAGTGEFLRVTRVTDDGHIFALRGQNGTTDATLSEGVEIFRWVPDDLIVRAVVRATGYIFRRRGAFEQSTYDGLQTITFPPDLPQEVTNILAEIPFYHGWMTVK